MADKIQAGFMVVDPVSTLCRGLSPDEELLIRARFAGSTSAHAADIIQSIENGDGGRVILMRAGLKLALDNPWGLDGSRQSYERLMEAKCEEAPKLNYAHSHNSWLDLSMAMGWIGVILFASVFIQLFVTAAKKIYSSEGEDINMALGLLALFWIVRGFFDSLFREHYLQMQALLMIYIYFMALRPVSQAKQI
jgi:O-antigen ligase